MSTIYYDVPLILDSGLSTVVEKSSIGSQFTVVFEDPLFIPTNAINCTLSCYNSTVWNTVYNVRSEGLNINNEFHIHYDGSDYIILIPGGKYDCEHLNNALYRAFVNHIILPDDLFAIVPDTASQRVSIQFNYIDTRINFTPDTSMRELLGFDNRHVPSLGFTVNTPQYEVADSTAVFNNIQYFTIGTDLITRGIRFNSKYYQTVVKIPINAASGSQIIYQPQYVPKIPCDELIGVRKKSMTIWLTDDKLQRVDTNNESFSISLVLRYHIRENNRILDY